MSDRPRVMESFVIRETTNPYQTQLVESLSARVEVQLFSWRAALRGRYDALHLHWPDVLIRDRTLVRTSARRVLFLLLLIRLRAGRKALVRTLHNVAPHEAGTRVEAWLLRLCDHWTTQWITLNESTIVPSRRPATLIPSGHYRDWFTSYPAPPITPGHLLYFGRIRRYKGVENLVAAFRALEDPSLRLRIAGNPDTADVVEMLERATREDARITALLRHVTDPEVATEFGRAELVVLPYREMHNSGAALLALSFRRPVLVPDNAVTQALGGEVGPQWVIRYGGELDTRSLAAGITALRADPPFGAPDLSGREWRQSGRAHAEVFARATRSRRTPRSR